MDGVLVVDKPAGITSHGVVGVVRKAAGQKKVGHAGTLDPDATGVLVVCLGRATRLVPYIQASKKTYEGRIRLGATTTTLDAAGDVVDTWDASGVGEPAVAEALASFVGDIEQVPPMVSAVKIGGERLHAKARRGEVVERPPRPVTIFSAELSGFDAGPPVEAGFTVTCSPGTYIRTLAADVGEQLGVGGHLASLRRTRSGQFDVTEGVSLDTVRELGAEGGLEDALMPPGAAVSEYPRRELTVAEARALGYGQKLDATGHDGPVAAVTADGTLVAMIVDVGSMARSEAVFAPAGG